MDKRKTVSEWIEEQVQEANVPALTWLLQRGIWGLLQCYPSEEGKAAAWSAVRAVIGDDIGVVASE